MGQLIHVRSLSTQERFKQNLQGGPRSGSVQPCWKMALPRGSLGASLAKPRPHVLLPGGQDVSSGRAGPLFPGHLQGLEPGLPGRRSKLIW